MLLIKKGLKLPIEVIDPEAKALIEDGTWREATADEAQTLADYYTANPQATSHAAKVRAAADAGLDATLAQPAQVVHESPQSGSDGVHQSTAAADADAARDGKPKRGKSTQGSANPDAESPEDEFTDPEG